MLVIFAKSLPVVLLAKIGKLNANPFQLGVGVGQVGEFSFVLGSIAYSQGAIDLGQFVGVLLAVVISIIGSVLLVLRTSQSNLTLFSLIQHRNMLQKLKEQVLLSY